MGKKGDQLRLAKHKKATYTFTGEQLKERDEAIIDAYKARVKAETEGALEQIKKDQEQYINEVWNKRAAEFNSGLPEENMTVMLSYLLSVSARVLIERFGWKPVRADKRKTRTEMFAGYVLEEIEKITTDEKMSVHRYADETYKLYGVRFAMEDEDEP